MYLARSHAYNENALAALRNSKLGSVSFPDLDLVSSASKFPQNALNEFSP